MYIVSVIAAQFAAAFAAYKKVAKMPCKARLNILITKGLIVCRALHFSKKQQFVVFIVAACSGIVAVFSGKLNQ